MTTKTTKTILFAALILTLIVPITGTNMFAAAQQPDNSATTKIPSDTIPEDKLLSLSTNKAFKATEGSKELLGYESLKDFTNGYYSAGNKKGDNPVMDERVKHNIILANFDILAGQMNANLDVFLLDVQKQMASGTYNPTEAEKKLYDWGIEIHPNPVMPDHVTPNMVKQVLQVWDERLSLGDVPVDLEMLDQPFWDVQRIQAICLHDNICNPDDSVNFSSFMPSAYASSIIHYAYVSAVPLNGVCYQTSVCTLSNYKVGTGVLSTSTPASSAHSTSQYVHVHGVNYITNGSPTANYSFTLSGHVGFASSSPQSFSTYGSMLTGDHYVYTSTPCNLDGSTGCGTYSGTIVAQAPYY